MTITQGKWEFLNDDGWCEIQVKEPLKSICAVNTNVTEHIANGKLLGAAPELLEALKVCWASLQTYGEHPIIKIQVEVALNKAVAV
jgi:hypothetical protein